MFTRRHPYLFFVLMMAVTVTVGMAFLSLIVAALSVDNVDYGGEKIGVIEIVGAIENSKTIIHHIKTFREHKSIKAIVLRIDSPGGGVGPSQEIYREIRKTIEEKKVIVSMGSVAASGGYYVAAASNGIVANPGTVTGSIGVIMGYTNYKELMEKIGLDSVVIKSGKFKDVGSPMRDMTNEEKALLQKVIETIHRQFVSDIAQGRSMKIDEVTALADGRIFTGEDAQKMGLVDRLGNLQDAVKWAGELAGISGEVKTVYPPKERETLAEYLMSSILKIWIKNGLENTMSPEVKFP